MGDNSIKASIFLSDENYKILDKELENSFKISIADFNIQNQIKSEHNLTVLKKKRLKIKKKICKIISIKNPDKTSIKIAFDNIGERKESIVQKSNIFLKENKANYQKGEKREIKTAGKLTFYEIIEKINRYTHLDCLSFIKILENSGVSCDALIEKVNANEEIIKFIVDEILLKVFTYEKEVTIREEEIELTKAYPFKIKIESLFDEVFSKEIGFKEFQELNKEFEYRIVFDVKLGKIINNNSCLALIRES